MLYFRSFHWQVVLCQWQHSKWWRIQNNITLKFNCVCVPLCSYFVFVIVVVVVVCLRCDDDEEIINTWQWYSFCSACFRTLSFWCFFFFFQTIQQRGDFPHPRKLSSLCVCVLFFLFLHSSSLYRFRSSFAWYFFVYIIFFEWRKNFTKISQVISFRMLFNWVILFFWWRVFLLLSFGLFLFANAFCFCFFGREGRHVRIYFCRALNSCFFRTIKI